MAEAERDCDVMTNVGVTGFSVRRVALRWFSGWCQERLRFEPGMFSSWRCATSRRMGYRDPAWLGSFAPFRYALPQRIILLGKATWDNGGPVVYRPILFNRDTNKLDT
jgi:hypothetical protein